MTLRHCAFSVNSCALTAAILAATLIGATRRDGKA